MVKNVMRKCNLTITTTTDGVENTITREGEMELSGNTAKVCYHEENAIVCMHLEGETAIVDRRGDYTLQLHLARGEKTKGELGIGGSSGEIQTLTRSVQYSIREASLLASLKYDLIISGEKQTMQLRLLGRYKD